MQSTINILWAATQLIIPLIVAGVLNQFFVKRTPWLPQLKKPIDGGLVLADGQRLLGSNKTWKGFLGMVLLCALSFTAFAALQNSTGTAWLPLPAHHWQPVYKATLLGAWLGLGYVLFELPNSYLKRRINIAPGTNAKGLKGLLFTIIDQADSALGVALFFWWAFPQQGPLALWVGLAGTAWHYIVNLLLFWARIKQQPG